MVHLTGFLLLLTCSTMMIVGVLKDYESCSRRVFRAGTNENRDSITKNDDQQDATTLAYLFIPNQLYMFRAMSSPIIRST